MSSLRVRAMPNDLESTLSNIDWVLIDLLAGILVELAKSLKGKPETQLYSSSWGLVKHHLDESICSRSNTTSLVID